MKKSISIVLAAAMLSTMAMAEPGIKVSDKIGVQMGAFKQSVTKKKGNKEYNGVLTLGSSNPGALKDAKGMLELTDTDAEFKKLKEEFNYEINAFEFTADNFSIRYKFAKGQELLDKMEFDGKGNIIISFKEVTNPKTDRPNVVLQELKVRSRKTLYDFDGKTKTMRSGQEFTFNVKEEMFYHVKDGELIDPFKAATDRDNFVVVGKDEKTATVESYTLDPNGSFVKITKSDNNPDMYRNDVQFSNGIIENLEGRVYVGDKIKFDLPGSINDDVKKVIMANEDATIEPLTVVMEGFSTNFTIRLNPSYIKDVESKDLKIYTVDNGKLAPANLKWNDADYVWEGKINKSTTYLVSDIALKGVAAGGNSQSNNPSTGLNVNVASNIVK